MRHFQPNTPPSAEDLIYRAYLQRDGKAAAERWRETRRPVETAANVFESKQPGWQRTARATEAFRKQALADLLGRVKGRELYGEKALRLAEEIIGPVEREKLACAYPLVLLLVKGVLEDSRRPGERGENDYHVLSNLPTVGVLCAAVTARKSSYTEKTIRRWLSPTAPHANALRRWLGWRNWYTDTLLEYRKGIDPKTGKTYKTGQSRGPVVGGTLFRVRLTPLEHISEERLAKCDKDRPSVIQPLKPQLQRHWRDLERDRHEGKTWGRSEHSVPLELVDVRVEEKRTSSTESSFCGLLYLDEDKTDEQPLALLTIATPKQIFRFSFFRFTRDCPCGKDLAAFSSQLKCAFLF